MADFIPITRLFVDNRHAHAPIAIRRGLTLDFAQFRARTAAYACFFAQHPVPQWALHYEDSLEFACALLGAWHAGKHVRLPADALPATQAELRADGCALAGSFTATDLAENAELPAMDFAFAELPHAQPCLTIYTSGSSGEPCAISKRLDQLTCEVATLAQQWQALPAQAQVLATVSHQHIYGLLFKVLWPLSSGRPFVSERFAYPEQLLARLPQAPCLLISSPAHLKRLPEHLPWQTVAPTLAAIFSSGGPLPETAVEHCTRLLGQPPFEVYGSSETGGVAWRQRGPGRVARWQPLPGVQVQVTPHGQLSIGSPHLAEPSESYISEDLAQLHPDGFELLGRSDRIVKLEEKRISLSQAERQIMETGWFNEVRALLLNGERDRLAMATVPNEAGWQHLDALGKRAFNEALRQRLRQCIPDEACPRHWRHLWAFPHNSQGKLRDSLLSPWFEESAPIFRVRTYAADEASVEVEVSSRSPYFDGHFPGHPILPGVAQLEWVMRIADALFPPSGTFRGMNALKFQQPIRPGTLLQLQLTLDRKKNSMQFLISSTLGQHASGRFIFAEAPCEPA